MVNDTYANTNQQNRVVVTLIPEQSKFQYNKHYQYRKMYLMINESVHQKIQ